MHQPQSVDENAATQNAGAHPSGPGGDGTELDRLAREELAQRFEIEEALSEHPQTIVYAAREPEIGRRVALRVVRAGETELNAHLRRAVAAAASLNHPHVVPLYRTGTERDLVWYTMRFVEGKSLAEWVRDEGPLDVATCLRIVEQVASAVYYAHRRGVSHGDVRMERVLLADREWAFVSEFELGRLLRVLCETGAKTSSAGAATARGYRVAASRARPADDQTALAVVICECLTGKRLTEGSGTGNAPLAERLPAVLTDARTDVPTHVVASIRRALSERASDRFISILDFVSALSADAAVIRHASPPRSEPYDLAPHVLFVEPLQSSRRWRVWAGVGGATLVAGTVALVVTQRQERVVPLPSPVTSAIAPRTSTGAGSALTTVPPADSLAVVTPVAPPMAVSAETLSVVTAAAPPRRPAPNERARRAAPLSRTRTRPSAPPAVPRTPALPARLFVSSRPWGSLYVDGELVGNTPKANVSLAPGPHRIRIVRNGFVSFEREVTAVSGDRIRLVDVVLQAAR